MNSTYGQTNYERGYTQVPRRPFAEMLTRSLSPAVVIDINVRASCGEAIFSSVIIRNKTLQKAAGYFDNEGNPLTFANSPLVPAANSTDNYKQLPDDLERKEITKKCAAAARALSKGVDYARYDFLSDGVRIFGGEMTSYPASGLSHASRPGEFGPDVVENVRQDLQRSWFFSTAQRGIKGICAHLSHRALGELDKTKSSRPS